MKIKNVIFDVGNVLVKWAPYEVIEAVFPDVDPKIFFQQMRLVWIDLNLGKLSINKAVDLYHEQFHLSKNKLSQLMMEFIYHQVPLEGSVELLNKLKKLQVNLFSITDNIKEIMAYHHQYSEFPRYFKDIIVSAEVKILKPDIRIYQYLLNKHNLIPGESVFIDDVIANVEGAMSAGMQAFQFINTHSCEKQIFTLLETTNYA